MTAKITINIPVADELEATAEFNKAYASELSKESRMDYMQKAKHAFDKLYDLTLKDYILEHGKNQAARKYGIANVQKVM